MKTPVPESLFNKFAQNTSATGCFCDFLKYNKHFKMNHKDRKKHKKKHKQSWSVHISVQSWSMHICMTWVWPQNFSHHTNNFSFVCLCHFRNSNPIMFEWINPLDTGRKLNVHKTFRRSPGRLLNVLCTFNLRPVSTGKSWVNHNNYHS